MADVGGNFVNPAYASPEQIKFLREQAKQLMTEQPVRHWAQGLGNIARALVGGYEGRQANIQEQASNQEFGRQLLDATASKDPAKIMALMANPRAQPLQALLIGKLLEWGPERGVTTPTVSVRGPTEPYFNREPGPVAPPAAGTVPAAPPSVVPPPTAPVPIQPNAETSSVGDIIPGSRTVSGSPDSAFDDLGKQYGVRNLGAINRAGTEQAIALERAKTKATREAEQEVKGSGTSEIVSNLKKNLTTDIPDAINYLDKNPNSTTGRVAYMTANVPGTPAFGAAERLRKVEAAALQHEIQTIENAEMRRVSPDEAQAMRVRLGLGQNQDYRTLRYNLLQLQKRYSSGQAFPADNQPVNQTPQSGQAQADQPLDTNAFKVHKVTPPGQW